MGFMGFGLATVVSGPGDAVLTFCCDEVQIVAAGAPAAEEDMEDWDLGRD